MSGSIKKKKGAIAPRNVTEWQACLKGLKAKQAKQTTERANLTERRQMLALAAAIGNTTAQKRIEQLAARERVLDVELVSLNQALAHAQAEIAAAEAAAVVEARNTALKHHEDILSARLKLVVVLEQRLLDMKPLLEALRDATRDVTESHYKLGGAHEILPPLALEAVGGRLCEFMAGIGFENWLPLARPEIRPASTSWHRAESVAQEHYHVPR